ncbi:hypothetical protein [Legionella sp. km772]|uniref:hypothetical protein n=1 Tax=Legionella sp. km772 TaxID=2498111 RepID=UPI000F8F81AC|nr:hypothetical protein [Legionella sp. km772]RUR10692.1 hypothetical protein ELY15_07835 [Legionella sp. km772]
MAFTLTLLGTDTQFSPDKVDGAYDKAETLSYISTLINNTSTMPIDEVTRFRNEDVAVIDGPTTLGTEVGDRIARGVAAVLEAISRGETDISVIAHSRGAVEALLVAHELERIQTLLKEPSGFKPELCNSVCPYTKAAMNGLHKASFEGLNWAEISKHIGQAKLSMLNIDPVPGGNYVGITRLSSLAWKDPRFYEVPKIVKEYEQFVYENERTRCFKPIVPKCASKETKFKLNSLPGHHGTGSGNLLDQQRGVNPTGKQTGHVQELVVAKLIDFLTRNGVRITPRALESDPFAHITSGLLRGDLGTKEARLKQIYFDLFNKIMANREAYQHYNRTSYATLGQEQALQKLIWKIVDQRIVHYQAHNDTFLETIIPPVPGGHFLNYEHARLHLNQELDLENDIPLHETINRAVGRLLKICEHHSKLKELKKTNPLEHLSVTDSIIGDRIAPTLETAEGFALLLDGVGTLIDEVRQSYLQNKLATHEQEAVYAAVIETFKAFEAYTLEHPHHEIAQTIFGTLKSNLQSTVTMKHKVLKDHYLELASRMQDRKLLSDLQGKIQTIIENLETKKSGENPTEILLIEQLTALARDLGSLNAENPSTKQITKFLEGRFEALTKLELSGDLAKESRELAGLIIIEAAEDNQVYRVNNIIREVITSYNDLEKFRKALPGFKELDSSLDYEQREIELEEHRARVVHLAAQYIAEHEIPVESIEILFGEENKALYQQITGLAIGFGAVNPLVLNLEKQLRVIQELSATQEEQVAVILTLTSKRDEQARMIETLTSERDEQVQMIELLTSERDEQARMIETLTSERDEQARMIELLTSKRDEQAQMIETLTSKRDEQARMIETLTSKRDEQVQMIETLTSKRDEQAQMIETLTSKRDEQARMIETLTSERDEQVRMIELLTAKRDEQAQMIETLTSKRDEQARMIETLTSERDEQVRMIELLTAKRDEQAQMIETLTSKRDEQARMIETLTSKRDEQARMIETLTSKTDEQIQMIETLTSKRDEQARMIETLTSERDEQVRMIEILTSKRDEQAQMIETLTSKTDEQAMMIKTLTSTRDEQVQLILGMTSKAESQEELIRELTTNKQEQAELIKELSHAKQKLTDENEALAQKVDKLTEELNRIKAQQNASTINVNDDLEFKFQVIVKNKLTPLTKDYLLHLAKEIKEKIDPNLDISTYSKLAANIAAITKWPENKEAQLLKQKFETVSQLNDILHAEIKPSAKVEQFYQRLNEADKVLSEHRDPAWKRYLTNTVVVLSIILTGVIPGLAVLLSGSTPKFWQSSGQTFFQKANKEMENNNPEPENDLSSKLG